MLIRERKTHFGAGYMSCPGQKWARIEPLRMYATLVRGCDSRPVKLEQEWGGRCRRTVTLDLALSRSKNGCVLRARCFP